MCDLNCNRVVWIETYIVETIHNSPQSEEKVLEIKHYATKDDIAKDCVHTGRGFSVRKLGEVHNE